MINIRNSIDVARNSSIWLAKSQDFYIAGRTLVKEQGKAISNIDTTNGKSIKDDSVAEIFAKAGMYSSIVFLLAFSIELLVKAILIKKDPSRWVPDSGNVKFSHNISGLVEREITLQFTDDESKVIKRISEYVSWGKYPERLNPGAVEEELKDLFGYHPYVTWSLSDFLSLIDSIRKKLFSEYEIVTNNS